MITLVHSGHDGKATNITMEPGQMILYESHSVIHGRPFPLRGNYYANVFVHFEPLGHTLRHSRKNAFGSDINVPQHAKDAYERALKYQQMLDENEAPAVEKTSAKSFETKKIPDLPPYIGVEQEVRWRQQYEFEKEQQVRTRISMRLLPEGAFVTQRRIFVKVSPKPTKAVLGLLGPHTAAADGDLSTLREIARKDRAQLFSADKNGWRPLHEAARSGRHKVIEYLIKEGMFILCFFSEIFKIYCCLPDRL